MVAAGGGHLVVSSSRRKRFWSEWLKPDDGDFMATEKEKKKSPEGGDDKLPRTLRGGVEGRLLGIPFQISGLTGGKGNPRHD